MSEKETTTLLSKVLAPLPGTQPKEKGGYRQYIDIILNEEIPILCINRSTGKKRLMPFKVLYDNNEYFWLKEGGWQYYISGDDIEKIKKNAVSKTGAWDLERSKSNIPEKTPPKIVMVDSEEELDELEVEVGYGKEYEDIIKMPTQKKLSHLFKQKQRLSDLLSIKTKDEEIVTQALVETAKDAALINHAALEEAMILGDDEAKRFTQEFVDNTHEMVKSSTQLMAQDVFNNELMHTLVEKSNGTIIQHMTRVYLNGVAFLIFYNNLVTTSSAIQKLRINFAAKYRSFYSVLIPHFNLEHIDLERVFLGGMRAIPPDLFYKWAVGFLIHDIGKASAIEYHEGESAYDRNKVVEHVKAGYKSIMTKTNYPMEASLITGYHHEYYGNPDGYGYFRAYLQQYKKLNPGAKQDHVITYDLEPMMDYHALAYFPAKVLEIVDVYDSVTDPHRVYRKAMTSEEALTMMRSEFIEKHRKLDPILFDVFEIFIREKHI